MGQQGDMGISLQMVKNGHEMWLYLIYLVFPVVHYKIMYFYSMVFLVKGWIIQKQISVIVIHISYMFIYIIYEYISVSRFQAII